MVFYPTEPLPLKRSSRKDDLTRWTVPSAGLPGLPVVCEQRHVVDNTTIQTDGSIETDYDQILELIDSYV